MNIRKIGNKAFIEFKTREEAIAYAEAKRGYTELWEAIYAAEMFGLLSPN